jgi:hypothetical protein
MSDPYRDSLVGLKARIHDLGRQVTARETRMTEQLWRYLPSDRGERLRALKTESTATGAGFDELARCEQALNLYLAALDEVIAAVPEIEQACRALPPAAPESRIPRRSLLEVALGLDAEAGWIRTCDRIAAIIQALDPSADLQRTRKEWLIRASFEREGTPFAFALYYGSLDEVSGDTWQVISTGVALASPRLRLAPELMGHWLLKPLRLVRDLQIDDDYFDGVFLIDAEDVAGARALLTRQARRALLKIAELDIPQLVVQEGRAELRFRCEPNPAAIAASVEALSAIRNAPLEVRLLRD